MNCGRHYNDDKGCLMWSLFTAFYCVYLCNLIAVTPLLNRNGTDFWPLALGFGTFAKNWLSLIMHSSTISGISWALAPRSRSISRPGIDIDFSARGLPLYKYIFRQIWIVSDNTAPTKHAWCDRYLPDSICELHRNEFFIQLRYWYLVIFTIFRLWYFSCGTEDQPTTILSLIPISKISIIPSLVL